jgi:hypothetical protein
MKLTVTASNPLCGDRIAELTALGQWLIAHAAWQANPEGDPPRAPPGWYTNIDFAMTASDEAEERGYQRARLKRT